MGFRIAFAFEPRAFWRGAAGGGATIHSRPGAVHLRGNQPRVGDKLLFPQTPAPQYITIICLQGRGYFDAADQRRRRSRAQRKSAIMSIPVPKGMPEHLRKKLGLTEDVQASNAGA